MSMGGAGYQSLAVPNLGGFGFNPAGRNSIGGAETYAESSTKPQVPDQMDLDEKVGDCAPDSYHAPGEVNVHSSDFSSCPTGS